MAARNVLVTNRLTLKVADFGLAKKAEREYYVRNGRELAMPLKWMSHEAWFEEKYSKESDVWAFGVTLYEVFTMGKIPYGKEFPHEWQRLKRGDRLPKPKQCHPEL